MTRALLETPQAIDWALLPRALLGLVALLCGNGYIVGINQIYDVDIDRTNKPFLPVAAGKGVLVCKENCDIHSDLEMQRGFCDTNSSLLLLASTNVGLLMSWV